MIIERYLWKTALMSILVVWLAFATLDSFFSFLQELSGESRARYGALEALMYIVYTLPQRLYDYFPTATLIGALLGMGQLAANSELTAMRAAGFSIQRIIIILLKLGLVLMCFVFALGEWIAPTTSLKAISFKTEKQQNNIGINRGGLWLKEDNKIIRVKKVWSDQRFAEISIFTIDERIDNIQFAKKAEKKTLGEQTIWQLDDVKTYIPSKNAIHITTQKRVQRDTLIPAQLLDISSIKPKHLSAQELAEYISHQDQNELNTIRLEQAFWTRFSTPLSVLVMLIIAIPFAFGSQRTGGAGQRLFIGIIVGLVFFLLNRSMGHMSIVYGISPLLSSVIPLLLFLSFGLFLLYRLR
ncbi:MAG TPA: LPS export ABC transporter permease LptG [Thiothrix sp.]|nr:LPS export ABC transporter permease LptG [Thiothrix sp.]